MPDTIGFTSKSALRYRHISSGIRHYLKGAYNNETTWNLYGLAGFGLLLMKATNTYNGAETLLGSGIYLYADVRTWIQASYFSLQYLYNNTVPRVVVLSMGSRILFN